MQKNIQLSIPEPCHENWEAMTPEAQGRFCQSCAKTVVDFTQMTDTEVFNFFKDKAGQQVCGRLATDQLMSPIHAVKEVHGRKWFWRYAAAFLLFMSRSEARAQGKVAVVKAPVVRDPKVIKGEVAPVTDLMTVKGVVRNAGGEPVGFASVRAKGATTAVAADEDGVYSLKVKKGTVLEVSAVGYAVKDVVVVTAMTDVTLEGAITIGEAVVVMTGAIAISGEPVAAYDVTKHVVELLVVDEHGQAIPEADVRVLRQSAKKEKFYRSNPEGRVKLHRIREDDSYMVTVSAEGYGQGTLSIAGNTLRAKSEIRKLVLHKNALPDSIKFPVLLGWVNTLDVASPAATPQKGTEGASVTAAGMVVDAATGLPLEGVSIQRKDNPGGVQTDATGHYRLSMSKMLNGVVVEISSVGYHPVERILLPGEANPVIELKPMLKLIDTVLVRAEPALTSFQGRLGGIFITGSEIKQNKTRVLLDKLICRNVIKAYPNPVQRNAPVHLDMQNVLTGGYTIRLFSNAGQLVQEDRMIVPAQKFVYAFQFRAGLTAGEYLLVVINPQQKNIHQSKIVVM